MKRTWTDAETAFLREQYPDVTAQFLASALRRTVPQIYNKAATLGLKKSAAFYQNAGASRFCGEHGKSTRFSKGGTPWNAGIKGLNLGGKETQFKPGHMPHNHNPIGHTRTTKDGYFQRKITDTRVTRHDYVMIHHLVWRMHGGVVPRGHALVFKDGDKTNIDINNLELITRTELMRRNTVHNLPKPLAEIVQLRGAITRQINKHERKTA